MSDDTAKGRTHRVRYPNAHEIVEVSDEVARRDFPHLFRAPANHLDTEARHVVDMVHALLDEAHAAEGPLVERVRGVLAQVKCRTIERNDAESSLAMLRQERDTALGERNAYRCQVNALRLVEQRCHEALTEAGAAWEEDLAARVATVSDELSDANYNLSSADTAIRHYCGLHEKAIADLTAERDAIKADRDSMLTADAAMVGELIDVLGDACLPSEIVTRVRALKEDREARAIVTRVRLLLQDLLAAGGES